MSNNEHIIYNIRTPARLEYSEGSCHLNISLGYLGDEGLFVSGSRKTGKLDTMYIPFYKQHLPARTAIRKLIALYKQALQNGWVGRHSNPFLPYSEGNIKELLDEDEENETLFCGTRQFNLGVSRDTPYLKNHRTFSLGLSITDPTE